MRFYNKLRLNSKHWFGLLAFLFLFETNGWAADKNPTVVAIDKSVTKSIETHTDFRFHQASDIETVEVKGKVVDSKGESIIGANVIVKGSSYGCVTNVDGEFQLKVPVKSVLVFSFIGYHKQEIAVNEKREFKVILKEDTQDLEEVVVIGYGEVRKQDLTGAVSQVKVEDLKDIPIMRVDQMLQGRIAGADIMSTSGEPGAGTSIRIRGTRSINATNEPLYVVDGVIDGISNLNELNPSDIESLEVLKDASSTAIYGSRGSNGVILITTKAGKSGKTRFSFRADGGFSQLPKFLDLMNATEFAQLQNDRYFFDYDYRPDIPLEGNTYPDPLSLGEGTNWTDEISRTAPYQNYTLSASGGNKDFKFFFSGNYVNEQGIIINSGLERMQGRLNLDKTFNDKVVTGLRVNYSYIDQDVNKADIGTHTAWYRSALFLAPTIDAYNEDGSFNDWNTQWYSGRRFDSPLAKSKMIDKTQLKKTFSAMYYLEYQPIKGLKLKSTISFYDYNRTDQTFEPSTLPTRDEGELGAYAYKRHYMDNNVLNENTIFFKKVFNSKHAFDALAGFTFQKKWTSNTSASGSGYMVDDINVNDLGALISKETISLSSSRSEQTLASVLGRLNYSYDGRYYITLTARADGASNFADGHKWAIFPSGAVKWNIARENFFKEHLSFIDDCSIRLSAGVSGNQGISPFRSLSMLNSSSNGYIFGGSIPVDYYPTRIADPSLTWEKTTSYDAGFDLSFLDRRFTLNLDYYQSYTKDLLLEVQLPSHTGYDRRLTNIGETSNKGIEVTLRTKNIDTPNFQWNTTFTIAHNKQMVENIGGLDRVVAYTTGYGNDYAMYAYEKGKPLNALWGMKYAGVWKSEDEIITERAKASGDRQWVSTNNSYYQPGRQRYVDQNKDGVLNNDDLVYLGNADPKFYGGFQNNFSIYGFDINLFFNYSIGGKIYNPVELFMGTGSYLSNQFKYMVNAWHPVRNPESDLPRANSKDDIPCDRFVHDASFLRLKDASISYTFKLENYTNLFRSLTLTATGSNLMLLKKYNGYDPEVSTQSEGSTIRRMDNGAYPNSRRFVFSAQLNF